MVWWGVRYKRALAYDVVSYCISSLFIFRDKEESSILVC